MSFFTGTISPPGTETHRRSQKPIQENSIRNRTRGRRAWGERELFLKVWNDRMQTGAMQDSI